MLDYICRGSREGPCYLATWVRFSCLTLDYAVVVLTRLSFIRLDELAVLCNEALWLAYAHVGLCSGRARGVHAGDWEAG